MIPGAAIAIDEDGSTDHRTAIATYDASFAFSNLRSAVTYHLTISAKGFADWTSPGIVLSPGQQMDLTDIKLKVGAVETTVSAVFSEQIALQQVRAEEKQRVLGIIPNFYVVYDKQFVQLTPKLKFQLAFRASTDVVSIAAAAFLAGVDQAADTPAYVQGAKGYGQRFGAAYAGATSDILIGGALLPTLLHQDPRYFYQGTGTKKSRALHALSAPFIARGDNGRWQPNYSSIGGDLAANALSNLYYPPTNRGAGLVFSNALITTGGRMANALAQEFLLHKITTKAKDQN
ncbi:carboxypeptidase-like regulatory domain-containing protein [Granulicella sp. L60]|uniref:carboxypeptidase-like regulatory domain-containing protein n=1 Tax=Granulicella sp. L60 TaxID=1641866 RepID=UPI0020B15446